MHTSMPLPAKTLKKLTKKELTAIKIQGAVECLEEVYEQLLMTEDCPIDNNVVYHYLQSTKEVLKNAVAAL